MNWLANLFAFTEATWLFVIGFLAVVLILSLLVPYFLLRNEEVSRNDSQLGLKVLLHFCFSVSLLAFVAGLTLVVRGYLEDWGSSRGSGGSVTETGWYLSLAAGALALMYFCSLHFGTNNTVFPAAGRMYLFWRFAVHNLVVVAAVLLLAITLSEPAPGRLPQYLEYLGRRWTLLAALIVWGPSWLLHLGAVWKQSTTPVANKGSKPMSWDVPETPAAP